MSRPPPHPFAWTLLIVPFGAISGFVGVVLAFLATRQGLTVAQGATLVAVGFVPHTWKFLWGPIVDTTLTRRTWYLLSAALCAAGIVAMASVPLGPATLDLMRAVIFLVNVAATTLGMAVEGLMAHRTPAEERGRAGGWFQAGNLGGSGIGGGLGLWLATHAPSPWMAGAVLAGVFALCALALLRVDDVPAEASGEGIPAAVRTAFTDLWTILRARDGQIAALICFLPIGSGAALGVLAQADVAALWGAGADEVGLVNGVLSGVIAALGCLAGGELCRRYPSRAVYAGVGALMAVVALAMAAAPLTRATFIAGGLAYSVVTGLAFAAFTGLVLETIGAGAAATKYNIYASLSNVPITYMGLLLAWVVVREGPRGMLVAEAGMGLLGIAVFFAGARVLGRRPAAGVAPVG